MLQSSESTAIPAGNRNRGGAHRRRDRRVLPALTILAHPAPERVGDRVILGELATAGRAQISRLTPDFSAPHEYVGCPLNDRFVSRKPWSIERLPGTDWRISVSETPVLVRVDGRLVEDCLLFQQADVDRGLVIELAERVVLLLGWHWPSTEPDVAIEGLIGESDEIAAIRREIQRVADLRVHVLIRGETGTGKELVAAALHGMSSRSAGPFVAVNLGALPASLAAGELFGATRGAYTGATTARIGCFQRADGGTLFLDEIGEAPTEIQVALLRAIDTGEVHALGEGKPKLVDVRAVSATDADLEEKIAHGTFKEPLMHRLAGYEIALPPLRRRRDDIGRLLLHFLREQEAELGETRLGQGDVQAGDSMPETQSRDEPWIDSDLVCRLVRFPWPGNVRQLRNAARQLIIGNRGRSCLFSTPGIERLLASTSDRLAKDGGWSESSQPTVAASSLTAEAVSAVASRRPADIDDAEILLALREHCFEVKAAAETLGISRAALYLWIEQSPSARTAGQLEELEIRRAYSELKGDLNALAMRLEVSRFALRRRLRELGL